MAAAAKVLMAVALARAASADCQSAYDSWLADLNSTSRSPCSTTDSACPSACVPAFQSLIDACQGQNYSDAKYRKPLAFRKALVVADNALLIDEPCREPIVDLVLAGGRCDPQDCRNAQVLLALGGETFCPSNETNPPTECSAICVNAMNAVYQRCDCTHASRASLASQLFMSKACLTMLDTCSHGVGCGSTGTTTEPPSMGTTTDGPSAPETCPPLECTTTTTAGFISFSSRGAAISLFAASPLAMLLA